MTRRNLYLKFAAGLLALSVTSSLGAGTAAAQNSQTVTPEQKAALEAKKKAAAQAAKGAAAKPNTAPKPTVKTVTPPVVKSNPKVVTPKPVVKPVNKVVRDTAPPPQVKKVTPVIGKPVNTPGKPVYTPGKPANKTVGVPTTNDGKIIKRPLVKTPPNVKPAPTVTTTPASKSVNPAFRTPNAKELNPGLPKAVNVTPKPPVKGPANLEALKAQRKEIVAKRGNAVVIKEPDQRTIVKKGGKAVIVHNEANRLTRVAPNAKTIKEGRNNVTVIERANNVQIFNVTDSSGQLIKRYRRDADGRETVLIDNESRRRKSRWGRNLAIGLGIGAGIVAGAAVLNAVADVPPPRHDLPPRKYVVDYEDASEDDVYEAFTAPPVDRIERRYTLDEVRATPYLRDRMRRVDLNDINFDSGSWEVDESQYGKLERVAHALKRAIDRNPNEVFMIEGYTDAVGSTDDNLTLSDRRAESVAVILSEQFDVPAENLTTQGYGEQYLKVPTEGPERANRRVALRRITPLISQGEGADDRR